MMNNEVALQDKNFIQQLCSQQLSQRFVKIISLNINEEPLEEIQGQITQGSISVDGKSIIRRTCSLTLLTTQTNFNEQVNWNLHTKVQIFVGLHNTINSLYPNIIWFKMGTYVLTSFKATIQNDGAYSIALQGKDKMCLLNGDVGGNLTALEYDFGKMITELPDGTEVEEAIPLKHIIQEAVHTYANEPYHNIIINDLDDYGLELLEYRGDSFLVYELNKDGKTFNQALLDLDTKYFCYDADQNYLGEYSLKEIDQHMSSLTPDKNNTTSVTAKTTVRFNSLETLSPASVENETFYFQREKTTANNTNPQKYLLIQIKPGMTCGYRETELVYAGDLTAAIGDPITKVLTNIQNMLSDFEYFYDLDGHFVFQKRKTSNYVVWNNVITKDNLIYAEPGTEQDKYTYCFNDNQSIISFDNNVDINNIKNDFSIWGTKKSINGGNIPIHVRYALHKKPQHYITWGQKYYTTSADPNVTSFVPIVVDWREIIYQMALDWNQYHANNDFYTILSRNNYRWYPSGVTGYEQYYTDMLGFWRDLYNPEQQNDYKELEVSELEYFHTARNYAGQWYVQKTPMSEPEAIPMQTYVALDGTVPLYNYGGRQIDTAKLQTLSDEEKLQLYYRKQSTVNNFCITRAPFNPHTRYYTRYDEYEEVEIPEGEYTVKDNEIIIPLSPNESGDYAYDATKKIFYIPSSASDPNPRYLFAYWTTKAPGDIIPHSTSSDWKYGRLKSTFYDAPIITQQTYDASPFNKYWVKKVINGKETYQLPTTKYLPWKENTTYYYFKDSLYGSVTFFRAAIQYKYLIEVLGYNLYTKQTVYTYYPVCGPSPDYEYNSQYHYFQKIDSQYIDDEASQYKGWKADVIDNPEGVVFWIDFLEPTGTDFEKYSVPEIGSRTKSMKDDKITNIYFNPTFNVLFKGTYGDVTDWHDQRQGYTIIQIPQAYRELFSISSQGQSAFDVVNSCLNDYTHLAENVSLTTDPLYFLQPNERIYIQDTEHNIKGEYAIDKLTIPLQANSQMSITATKIIPLIFG